MNLKYRPLVAIVLTGIWVNASEFFRNEVLLKDLWVNHYKSLGLVFPSAPLNAAMWVAWGFLFAIAIYALSRRFGLLHTALLSWLTGFVLMWVATWNLGVLPPSLLLYAVPLSLLEAFVGSYIAVRAAPR